MPSVEQTMLKVQRLLTGPMKLRVALEQDYIQVQWSDASTAIRIRVHEWGKDQDGEPRTLVRITAPILRDVRATPELFEWVARSGSDRWFGHIEVFDGDQPGTVHLLMAHTLLGDFLDEAELGHAMFGVLGSADQLDDELKQRFGGKRWADE